MGKRYGVKYLSFKGSFGDMGPSSQKAQMELAQDMATQGMISMATDLNVTVVVVAARGVNKTTLKRIAQDIAEGEING